VLLAVVDAEVLAIGEVTQPRVVEVDVVDLEVGLDEGLPVDVVLVGAHRVEDVAAEVPVGHGGDAREVFARVARPGEEQAVPVDERRRMQLDAGALRKMRRAEQLALEIVGPAVQRADDVLDVAAAFQHERLAVAAHVGEQLDPGFVAHQHLRVARPGQRVIVADLRHHQLVADVIRAGVEQVFLFQLENLGIEVPGHRKVTRGRLDLPQGPEFRHAL
jgi:hypothetical protein